MALFWAGLAPSAAAAGLRNPEARTGNPRGRCLAVRPLSHPGNLMGRAPWKTARAARLFHRAVLAWDDRAYGRPARPRPAPEWMRVTMDRPLKSGTEGDAP